MILIIQKEHRENKLDILGMAVIDSMKTPAKQLLSQLFVKSEIPISAQA
jgi:hypothetical protein